MDNDVFYPFYPELLTYYFFRAYDKREEKIYTNIFYCYCGVLMNADKPILHTIDDDGVMRIVINRPAEQNGLNWEANEMLADCYREALDNPDIRVIVLTGNREYFHTGGRVNAKDEAEQKRYADSIERMQQLQDALTIPVICAVSGDCLKGGMAVLADADLAIARQGVRFGFPEVRMGGVPMVVMASTISMPKKMALEAYYSSEYFSAEDALRMGLVNCVVSDDEFEDTVSRYVKMITDKPRALIEMTREAYYTMSEMPAKTDRKEYALRTLRTKVLTEMAVGKTEDHV